MYEFLIMNVIMNTNRYTNHLLEFAVTTPLSIENASLGSPAMFHDCICIGSPRVFVSEKSPVHGIPWF